MQLYRLGDSLPMYARVAALQTFLNSKEVQPCRMHGRACMTVAAEWEGPMIVPASCRQVTMGQNAAAAAVHSHVAAGDW